MLTPAHIARVTSPTGSGSGCVIAPRLVLTSAHVVPETGGQVSFFTAQDESTHTGTVVWRGTPHGRDDAALVRVTSPTWNSPPAPTRWGRLVSPVPGKACHTWGYPDLAQRQDRAVETSQLSGTMNPGSRLIGDRYVMDISTHPPDWGRPGSPWGGMSGAALISDGMVAGVVATTPAHQTRTAIEAVPAYVLHHDPAFRAVLAEHGVSLVLEPVELAHLAHGPGTHQRLSPAALLEAHRQVVDFHGRDQVMDTLAQWCADDGALSAMVVHGPGGQGKTRLAHELTANLTHPDGQGRRWATVWLRSDATAEELGPVKDTTAPLLVVVDYAETRTPQLVRLLRLCDRPPGSPPVRLLLLVRSLGEWWEEVNTATGDLLTEISRQLPLPPLVHRASERTREYRTALHQLAHALPTVREPQPVDWEETAVDLPEPDLSGPEWETVLSVHMRALADLLDADRPDTAVTTAGAVEARVLAHEYRYWNQAAAAQGLGDADLTQPLRDVLALAFNFTPDNVGEADRLLEEAPVLAGQSTARRHQIRRWISGLYPTDGSAVWGRLQPDRVLEHFLGQRLERNPALFDPHLHSISATDADRLVTLYARAAAHPALPSVGEHLTGLCTRHLPALGPAVIEAATRVENPGPLIHALDAATVAPEVSLQVLQRLSDSLPHHSQRLAAWSERLATRLVEAHREVMARRNHAGPALHDDLRGLATALHNQALRLGSLGRAEEALEAVTEAVEHSRTLAEQNPDAHLPGLALALGNQAGRLHDQGRFEEALEVSTEALRVHRTVAGQRPDTYLPGLAAALNNHAVCLSSLSRVKEALEVNAEAVEHYQILAEQNPDTHLLNLALALNNQANSLNDQGRTEEALQASTEAVKHYQILAEQNPDTHLPDLALALNNQANSLSELGRAEEALQVNTEAIRIRRVLADQRPDVHLLGLARSLDNRSRCLNVLGRKEEALEASTEATHIRRDLRDQHPDRPQPGLPSSLMNQLGNRALSGREEDVRDSADLMDEYVMALLNRSEHDQALSPGTESAIEAVRKAMEMDRASQKKRPASRRRAEGAREHPRLSNEDDARRGWLRRVWDRIHP